MDRTFEIKADKRVWTSISKQMFSRQQSVPFLCLLFALYALPSFLGLLAGYKAYAFYAFSAALALLGLWPLIARWLHIHRSKKKWALAKPCLYQLTDKYFTVGNESGRVEIYWTGLENIHKFKEGWLLAFASRLQFIVPTAALDAEIDHFLTTKLTENKGANRPKGPKPLPISQDY